MTVSHRLLTAADTIIPLASCFLSTITQQGVLTGRVLQNNCVLQSRQIRHLQATGGKLCLESSLPEGALSLLLFLIHLLIQAFTRCCHRSDIY
jgi:hypothetical protein